MAKDNFDVSKIPDDKIMNHPLVQELSEALKISDFKVPLTLPKRTLMEEGTWNNHFYSSNSIEFALQNTDWLDRNKRDLFLDHEDKKASEWIGEVQNIKMKGKKLIGDLVIHDPMTAIKMQSGKPKIGISPKVIGKNNIKTNEVVNFLFDNFSIVYNPAVKTAYINNSEIEPELAEVTDFEAERKKRGMSVSEFYAIPKDPPSTSKLPIFDTTHVRNALTRINQVKGVSTDELATAKGKIKTAAKKFGITTELEDDKMAEEEKTVIEPKVEEEKPSEKPSTDSGESTGTKEDTPEKTEETPESAESKELSELDEKIKTMKSLLSELEGKRSDKAPEAKASELEAKLSAMEQKMSTVTKLVEDSKVIPDRRSVNTASVSADVDNFKSELSEIRKDPDAAMLKFMKEMAYGGGINE